MQRQRVLIVCASNGGRIQGNQCLQDCEGCPKEYSRMQGQMTPSNDGRGGRRSEFPWRIQPQRRLVVVVVSAVGLVVRKDGRRFKSSDPCLSLNGRRLRILLCRPEPSRIPRPCVTKLNDGCPCLCLNGQIQGCRTPAVVVVAAVVSIIPVVVIIDLIRRSTSSFSST